MRDVRRKRPYFPPWVSRAKALVSKMPFSASASSGKAFARLQKAVRVSSVEQERVARKSRQDEQVRSGGSEKRRVPGSRGRVAKRPSEGVVEEDVEGEDARTREGVSWTEERGREEVEEGRVEREEGEDRLDEVEVETIEDVVGCRWSTCQQE